MSSDCVRRLCERGLQICLVLLAKTGLYRNRNLLLSVFFWKGPSKTYFFGGLRSRVKKCIKMSLWRDGGGCCSPTITPDPWTCKLYFLEVEASDWQWVVFHCNVGRAGSGNATQKIISTNQPTTKSVYGVWFVQTVFNFVHHKVWFF